jgi:hypothetical protein
MGIAELEDSLLLPHFLEGLSKTTKTELATALKTLKTETMVPSMMLLSFRAKTLESEARKGSTMRSADISNGLAAVEPEPQLMFESEEEELEVAILKKQ